MRKIRKKKTRTSPRLRTIQKQRRWPLLDARSSAERRHWCRMPALAHLHTTTRGQYTKVNLAYKIHKSRWRPWRQRATRSSLLLLECCFITLNMQDANVVMAVVFRLTFVLTKTDNFVGSWPARFLQQRKAVQT